MGKWPAKVLRLSLRSLAPAALVALAPKCVLCVLAYAGIAAALGVRSPEICGEAIGPWDRWAPSLAAFGVALGVVTLLAVLRWLRIQVVAAGDSPSQVSRARSG